MVFREVESVQVNKSKLDVQIRGRQAFCTSPATLRVSFLAQCKHAQRGSAGTQQPSTAGGALKWHGRGDQEVQSISFRVELHSSELIALLCYSPSISSFPINSNFALLSLSDLTGIDDLPPPRAKFASHPPSPANGRDASVLCLWCMPSVTREASRGTGRGIHFCVILLLRLALALACPI